MTDTPHETAKTSVHNLPEIGAFILEQAQERLRSQLTAAIALDNRIVQAAVILFAAAAAVLAVSAGAPKPVGFVAVLASVAFTIGGATAFRGVRSDVYHLSGPPPAWWIDAAYLDDFGIEQARTWVAGAMQDALDANDLENCARADALNLALRFGLAGVACTVLALAIRLFA